MITNRLMLFAPSAVLAIGCLLISGMREQHQVAPAQPMSALPAVFDGKLGRDIVIDSAERKVAGMSDYALREFVADSSMLFSVYVGYYDRQMQGKTIHSPKNCLPGAGWEILSSKRVPAASGATEATVNRVVLANKGTRALVYYWYQGRGRIESSEYVVKWNLLRDAALYGRTEEALVRIVVPIGRAIDPRQVSIDDDHVRAAEAIARRVAIQLEPAVSRMLPSAPAI